MREYGNTLFFRVSAIFIIALIATNIAVFSVKLASTRSSGISSTTSTAFNIGGGLKLISRDVHSSEDSVASTAKDGVGTTAHTAINLASIGLNSTIYIVKSSFSDVADITSFGFMTAMHGIGDGFAGIFGFISDSSMITLHGVSSVFSFASHATDLSAIIKPAGKVITPKLAVPVLATNAVAYTKATTAPAAAPQSSTPAAAQPTPKPAASAPVAAAPTKELTADGDPYAWGNCTWWVYMLRQQIGETIPGNWGNAADWTYNATSDGYTVDHTPSYGAIMQISGVDHGLGHVAFVESVDPDGTWHISEMNVIGLDEVDNKAMPASAAADYYFIHN
jgi:surface antigen